MTRDTKQMLCEVARISVGTLCMIALYAFLAWLIAVTSK